MFVLTSMIWAFQNEPDGFRGLKWGDPPTVDMEYHGESGKSKWYSRPTDKMKIGNVQLCSIAYWFYGEPERFYVVFCIFSGKENYDLLETICKGRYGEPAKEEWLHKLYWLGQKGFVRLEYDPGEGGFLVLGSVPIMMEMIEAEKQKEIEEAEGGFLIHSYNNKVCLSP